MNLFTMNRISNELRKKAERAEALKRQQLAEQLQKQAAARDAFIMARKTA